MEEKNKDFTTGTGVGPEELAPETGHTEGGPAAEGPENNGPTVEYASPMKRLWAWVGLVYAVGYALLMAYAFARGDFPQGIGQLLLAPALAGLGASVILRYREGKGRGGLPVCIGLSGASFALALWNLIQGLPVLLGQL